MKEARYLIRLAQSGTYKPSDQADLLARVREFATPLKGQAINLRVSPIAVEFDLFCDPEADLKLFSDAFGPLGYVMTCKRLDLPPGPMTPQKIIDESRRLFNKHRYWEVHEVLEGLWKELKGSEKQLVQGLILTAAALVHAQKNEEAIVWTMLEDALKRLESQPDLYYDWDIKKFRNHFELALASRKLDFPTV